ncbi:MAG: alpha/beta hydrolase [Desulfobacterales bacterium]|nr:MAG: alpha/beta hydrolase [Desulfobacterales bacterium]
MALNKIHFSKKYITMNDGTTIALWDTKNEAMPLVFVHGFPENHHCWDYLLSSLPNTVTKSFRLITYDLRGFGESSKTGEASITRLYEDHQTIIETLQLPSYHFIGHDWGGALALQTARFNPQSLTSATVMNTNFWKTDLAGMWHLIFLNIPLLPKIVFKWFPKKFFEFALLRSFANPNSLKPQILDGYFEMFCDTETTQYWIRLYKNMAKSIILQIIPYLSAIFPENKTQFPQRPTNSYHVDVMLVWGEDDRFAPLWIGKDMHLNLTKRGANVTFHTISEAGHFVQEDQPEKIVPLLIEHWNMTEEKSKEELS